MVPAAIAAALLSAAPAPASQAAAPGGRRWQPHVHAAAVWARRRRGTVAFAVATRRRTWGWHSTRTFRSASLVKPILLLAYLERGGTRHRPLHRSEKALLGPMIRRSDNGAASRVFRIVGLRGVREAARRARMHRFTPVAGYWGLSRIDARDQARFFLRIDRLLPRRHRAYAMGLLHSIVREQRWGIAQVRVPGFRLYFKGGWLLDRGGVDHQSALLVHGGRRVALSILTAGGGGGAYGNATLRGVAKRLLHGLHG